MFQNREQHILLAARQPMDFINKQKLPCHLSSTVTDLSDSIPHCGQMDIGQT
jgi:hypothetical protein